MSDPVAPARVRVAVVVVTHRSAESLERCLRSVADHGGVDQVVVVDTGGAATVDDRSVVVLRLPSNPGFGAAANRGFDRAVADGADVVVLLNDDVVVTAGWIEPLLAAVEPGVGAVQPLLLFDRPGTPVVNSAGVEVGRDGAGVDIGLGQPASSIADETHRIELFTGGAVAFGAAFLADTGGFDERYFLYYEDVDLGRRGAALGWSYRCAPASVVRHVKGASTDDLGDRLAYFRERNRLWSAWRNESAAVVARATWLSVRRLRHPPRLVHLRALVVGLAGGVRRGAERVLARR